jgi:hypothetical protein
MPMNLRVQPKEAPPDPAFWRTRVLYHEREIHSIMHKLNQFFGGVQDEYDDSSEARHNSVVMANKLRKLLEQHRVGLAAAKDLRFPTDAEQLAGLKRLGPLARYQKLAYSYDRRQG